MQEGSSRYLIGIDLGTTNSVVAYIDTRTADGDVVPAIHCFQVPQLVAPGEVRELPTLPSFLYFPTEHELATESFALPWQEDSAGVTGTLAREQGALVPGRLVSSAKSWLSYGAVNRRSRILPWGVEPPEPTVSPVEASSRYLAHLRKAWNHTIAAQPQEGEESLFENQEIVLTVPASFDEEARELTVEAAQIAGLSHVTLLEEPLAAFYAWISSHPEPHKSPLRNEDLVLICDIGGGTSDFSLVRASVANDDVQFERTAIGEHLLLGGDNLDAALAHLMEGKLGNAKLSLRQRNALQRACCAAKERLLIEDNLESLPITVLGSGRAVVGQAITCQLQRDEVVKTLTTGFLPLTAPNARPATQHRAGLREMGLPYATDPAITRHLAAFLAQAAAAMAQGTLPADAPLARPDAILFNGGFCTPSIVRNRIVEAIGGWFQEQANDWRPAVLGDTGPESAVAIGAAYYGRVRRGLGRRIRAGSARSYYIGIRTGDGRDGVCVLPAGTEEGTSLTLSSRRFSVLTNRPVSFNLYSSRVRHDAHGEVASMEADGIEQHAPLVTLLRFGKRLRELELEVQLRVNFTEVGTLEVWCESLSTPHRWRMQFELRGYETPGAEGMPAPPAAGTPGASVQPFRDQLPEAAADLIRAAFGKQDATSEAPSPEKLVSSLETALEHKREAWPVEIVRQICDALYEMADGRRTSRAHEVRWLNLYGFCLRPGFGTAEDDRRIAQLRRIYPGNLAAIDDLQLQVEWLIAWRRVSGGLNASQQRDFYDRHATFLGAGRKKPTRRLNKQVEQEGWRLLAGLEHIPVSMRIALGSELLHKLKREPSNSHWLWALGRTGSRIPLYGPLTCVVPPETVAQWIALLFELREFTADMANTVIQLAYRTDDASRDISDDLRQKVIHKLSESGVAEELLQPLRHYVVPGRAEAVRAFGESLPRGLNLGSSTNCLLSVTALRSQTGEGNNDSAE